MKVTEVQGATLGVVHLPGAMKPWRLTIQDPHDKSVIWVDMTQEIADAIVEKLSSGIKIASTIPKPPMADPKLRRTVEII